MSDLKLDLIGVDDVAMLIMLIEHARSNSILTPPHINEETEKHINKFYETHKHVLGRV